MRTNKRMVTFCAMIAGGAVWLLPGCGVVPQRRLDDSRLRIQALQAENEQLRDVVLNVRSQNRDISNRALEDARRIQALEDTNRRLERSILSYQDEAKQMSALFDQLREQVRLAAASETVVSMRQRLETLVARYENVSLDSTSLTLGVPSSQLFDGASGSLREAGGALLEDLAAALRADATQGNADEYHVAITGTTPAEGVELVSDGGIDSQARATWALNKVRERIERGSGLADSCFSVHAAPTPDGERLVAAAGAMVYIRLVPSAPPNLSDKP